MSSFAWTPGTGAYKHYPPYVNLTGNRLTVRGTEDLSGEHPMMGATVSIDLPDEVIAELSAALQSERASMEGEIELLSDEAGLRELGLLYNHSADDSRQFTRWQMIVAINHGIRLAALTSSKTGDER